MDIKNMMKQAKDMQMKMEELQKEIEKELTVGSAGGGMVKATVNGKQFLVNLEIEEDVVDPEDITMLQDLVIAAINDAVQKSQQMAAQKMQSITGGLNIPGLS